MFLFLPIIFGCPTRMNPEGDQGPRICPRCHNASTIRVKSRTWFELCFVPLIPMSSKREWFCTICQWRVPLQQNWEPAQPGYGWQQGPGQWQAMSPPPNAHANGYQPQYTGSKPN